MPLDRHVPALAPAARDRLLAAYATRADGVEWDVVNDRAVIAIPKRYSRAERFFTRFFPGPDVLFITLDEMGSEAWFAADGTVRVRDVAERLRERFGAKAEPADDRAATFFAELGRRNFIVLYEGPRPARDDARGFTPEKGYSERPCRRCGVTHPIRAVTGARYACPRCRAVNRVA